MADLTGKLKISVATVNGTLKDDPVVSRKTKKKLFHFTKRTSYSFNDFANYPGTEMGGNCCQKFYQSFERRQ